MKIDINRLGIIIDENRCAFLCGNGLSSNFDSDFGNIYSNLYEAHKNLIYNSKYDVKSNETFKKKCQDNYKSVLRYLRYFSESELMQIFKDALLFAQTIKNNKQITKDMWDGKYIKKLTFGITELDILHLICDIGEAKGIKSINIEHWTILIYFYYVIKDLKPKYYTFPEDNTFITVVKQGDVNHAVLIKDAEVYHNVIFNGFNIYYKILFSIAIFANGKSISLDGHNNIPNLDLNKIKIFLNRFDLLLTLNYDHILEMITNRKVEHLHGKFINNQVEYVYHQSCGLNYQDQYISFSDILLGDYFFYKTFLPVVNVLAKDLINKSIDHVSKVIERLIKENGINSVVIFGMSICNDQHILRNITISFFNANTKSPIIVYCYFSDEELREFTNQYEAVITYREDLNEYVRGIDIHYLKTQDLLKTFFYK